MRVAVTLLLVAAVAAADDDDDEEEVCGELCHFFLGVLVDQFAEHALVPFLRYAYAAESHLVYFAGVALSALLLGILACSVAQKIGRYMRASSEKRSSMLRKDAAAVAGAAFSSKLL